MISNNIENNKYQSIFNDLEDIVNLNDYLNEFQAEQIQKEELRPAQDSAPILDDGLYERADMVEQCDSRKRKRPSVEQAEEFDQTKQIEDFDNTTEIIEATGTIFGEKIKEIKELFAKLSPFALGKYAHLLSNETANFKSMQDLDKADRNILMQIRKIMRQTKEIQKCRHKNVITYPEMFELFKLKDKISEARKTLSEKDKRSDSIVPVSERLLNSIDANFKKLSHYALVNYGQLLKEDSKPISFNKISDAKLTEEEKGALSKIRKIMVGKKQKLATINGIRMTYAQIAELFNLDGKISEAKINSNL